MTYKLRIRTSSEGQSTVEYAIVLAAFLVMLIVCGLLFRTVQRGFLFEKAYASASHSTGESSLEFLQDVISY